MNFWQKGLVHLPAKNFLETSDVGICLLALTELSVVLLKGKKKDTKFFLSLVILFV
jgi:hypothetical protein